MLSALIVFPDSFDFPIFRSRLSLLQQHVDEIIICFTSHGNHSLREWLMENMPGVRFLSDKDASSYQGDWRSKATNLMIDHAQGDWLLSLEPDFFIKDYSHFFAQVKRAMNSCDVIMFSEGVRFHPACLFVKKEYLNRTRRDFSPAGVGYDHFATVSEELKGFARITTLHELGLVEGEDWLHLGGLTENYFAPKPYFDLPSFHQYNDACMKIEPVSDYWRGEMERCSKTERINIETSKLGRFL